MSSEPAESSTTSEQPAPEQTSQTQEEQPAASSSSEEAAPSSSEQPQPESTLATSSQSSSDQPPMPSESSSTLASRTSSRPTGLLTNGASVGTSVRASAVYTELSISSSSPAAAEQAKGMPPGILAAVILCSLLGATLLSVLVGWLCLRRRSRKRTAASVRTGRSDVSFGTEPYMVALAGAEEEEEKVGCFGSRRSEQKKKNRPNRSSNSARMVFANPSGMRGSYVPNLTKGAKGEGGAGYEELERAWRGEDRV